MYLYIFLCLFVDHLLKLKCNIIEKVILVLDHGYAIGVLGFKALLHLAGTFLILFHNSYIRLLKQRTPSLIGEIGKDARSYSKQPFQSI